MDTISEDDWERTFAVNVKGTFLVSRHAIKAMRQNGGGVIVHVASVAAEKGVPDRAAYSASKGALLALTRAMARDYLAENIRVNCVSPGTTYTPSLERRLQAFADPAKARAEFVARQPMGRFGEVDEIATAILFAASDEAAFMNGENIAILGGMTICWASYLNQVVRHGGLKWRALSPLAPALYNEEKSNRVNTLSGEKPCNRA